MALARAETRGTQSFLAVLQACWRRPSLLALELAWRWLYGAPALVLLIAAGLHIYRAALPALTAAGLDQLSLQDPMRAAVIASDLFAVLWPPVLHAALWLAPLLLAGWSLASGVGRVVVLRRLDPTLPARAGSLILLQALRVAMLAATFAAWFAGVRWAAAISLSPSAGAEPNLVLYCALVICLSLGIFSLWALLSWVFSIAPMLALAEDIGVAASLSRSLRLRGFTSKLVEINLVMGIVKLALIVLAMVFSATPLPFEAVIHGGALYLWWAVVTLLYMAASDFFQVARLAAFFHFWRAAHRAR